MKSMTSTCRCSPYSLRYQRQVELKDSMASNPDYIQNGISVPLAAESFKPKISAASELKDSMASNPDYIQNGISVPLAAESFKPKISAASELKDSMASNPDYIQNGISVPLAAESLTPKISAASELKDSMASKTHTHLSYLENPELRKVQISVAKNLKKAYAPSDFQFTTTNWQSHVNDLSIERKRTLKDKTKNFALNYSKYKDENKPDGVRQKDNIEYSDALILDFDGGDFSKDDFIRIFNESGTSNQNNKKLKLSFVIEFFFMWFRNI